MFKIIDFKFDDYNTGYDINFDKLYKVRNTETNEEKWIDEYELNKYKKLSLIEN